MEEVKNFEKLIEDLKQNLTSIVATPKTREILDMIVEAHKQVVATSTEQIKKAEDSSSYYFNKYYALDHKHSELQRKLNLQHEIITQLLCEKYQIPQREEDTLPF